jgi:hypothetical protein
MKNKWLYGNSWEKYPIDTHYYIEQSTNSIISVCDITKSLPNYMLETDLIYCDPPWLSSNLNSFYTKAGLENNQVFESFVDFLFMRLNQIAPNTCFLEVGRQSLDLFKNKLLLLFKYVEVFQITYYKKYTCFLLRGSNNSYSHFDYTGYDDSKTPLLVMQNEQFTTVGDLCTGRGLTGITAYKLNKRFVGTELNKRRLAVMIDIINNKYQGNYVEVI